MLTLTYEYKLVPTPEQKQTFDKWLEVCRSVWNFALRERKDFARSRKCDINACSIESEYIIPADAQRPTYGTQCKALTAAKKEYAQLKIVHSQVLQQVLKQLEKAFISMWERGFGFPRFKKLGRMRSFLFPQMNANDVSGDMLRLPSIGKVKMRLSRPIPDGFALKQVRIVKRASGYYAMLSLQADVNIPDVLPHGNSIGIDLGLEKFLATSEGELIARPRFFVESQRQLKLLQRRLKHKKKRSKNWQKLNQKIAKRHEQISNRRKDYHFKVAHYVCDRLLL